MDGFARIPPRGRFGAFWEGLVIDPTGKHLRAMGMAIWLFNYLILSADWETGRLRRKYETIGNDMGVDIRRLKNWMGKLKKHNYVEVKKEQHSMVIQVTKWRSIKRNLRSDSLGSSKQVRREKNGTEKCNFSSSEGKDLVSGENSNTSLYTEKINGTPGRREINSTTINVSIKSPIKLKEKEVSEELVNQFISKAQSMHKSILSHSLIILPKEDKFRVAVMLEQVSLPVLKAAFEDFVTSKDPYLADKPRNIAVFNGQVSHYVEAAERRLANQEQKEKRAETKQRALAKTSNPEAQKFWEKCLEDVRGECLEENVEALLDPLVCRKINGKKLVLACADEDHKRQVEEIFGDYLEYKLKEIFSKPMVPEFIIEDTDASR